MGPRYLGWPPPPKPRPSPPRPPGQSDLDSPFFDSPCASQIFEAAELVWADEGWVHDDKPLWVGGVAGAWWWQPKLPGRKRGVAPPPPSEKGVKMFGLARPNVFTPDVKKEGASHWRFIAHFWHAMGLRGMECARRTWTWTPTWLEIMGIGRFDPSADNRGAYARLVHGIASHPKPKPKAPTTPATGGSPQPHYLDSWGAFAKALEAIPPGHDKPDMVC